MQIEVVYRNVTQSDALTSYAQKKFGKAERLAPASSILVTLSREGVKFTASARLGEPGREFSAKEANEDLYAAIDLCGDRLCQQMRRAGEKEGMIGRESVRPA